MTLQPPAAASPAPRNRARATRPSLAPWVQRRVPLVLQMEAAECGIACLAMILGYFGRHESLEALRMACPSSRDGVDAAGLVTAASQFGLETEAYRIDLEEISTLDLPAVLHWEFNHFVVLEHAGADRFVIVDPARGRRRIGRPEMNRAFTGIALTFRPMAGFQRIRSDFGVVRSLWQTLAESKAAAVNVVLTGILLGATGILLSSVTRLFVDEYLGQDRREWLMPLLAGMVVLAVARGGLSWASAQIALFLQTRINALISSRIVWTLLRLPFTFLASRSAAEISTRMQIAGQIAGTASGPLLKVLNSVVLLVAYALAMLAYNATLTGLVLLVAAANLVILRFVERAVMDANADAQMAASKAHAFNIRGIALLEEARATGMVRLLFRRLIDAFVDETNAHQKAARVGHRLGAIPYFSGNVLSLVVLCAGAYEVMRSEMTIGTLLAFQMLAELFVAPLSSLVGLGSAVLSVSGGLARTNDLLGGEPRRSGPDDAAPFSGSRLAGRVSLQNVTYGYRGRPVLFGPLSVEVAPGRMLLIVGDSGSGKTSLAMILAGVMTPTDGKVLFDGRPADDIPAETFRYSLGHVEQTPFFAGGALRDALSLWDQAVPTSALQAALEIAAADEVISSRPGGLSGRIGENGMGFSGGELQRLALARALANAPSILIMDDATTALDAETEGQVLSNLRARGLTVIMVSGRREIGEYFDEVIELQPRPPEAA